MTIVGDLPDVVALDLDAAQRVLSFDPREVCQQGDQLEELMGGAVAILNFNEGPKWTLRALDELREEYGWPDLSPAARIERYCAQADKRREQQREDGARTLAARARLQRRGQGQGGILFQQTQEGPYALRFFFIGRRRCRGTAPGTASGRRADRRQDR
jgi:hypothetical protein